MKVTKFDQANLTKIANEVNDAVKEVAAKYGIQIKTVGGGTYNATEYTLKLKMNVLGESGEKKLNPMIEMLAKQDFGPNFDITKTFRDYQLGPVQFVDFNTRARKNPWVIKSLNDGKEYVISLTRAHMIINNPIP